jgi:hypothetical protein
MDCSLLAGGDMLTYKDGVITNQDEQYFGVVSESNRPLFKLGMEALNIAYYDKHFELVHSLCATMLLLVERPNAS